ncbi:hypothetical protein ACY12_003669 [Salmonella enterica subsp. enterica serovar Portland]|nr:hypothetical protein [Salmonella enterica subsp. enterica serovar Claibornei]EGZ4349617.1 hypothetical protein [Salmonella enterica subsp. enterica serovar Portland]
MVAAGYPSGTRCDDPVTRTLSTFFVANVLIIIPFNTGWRLRLTWPTAASGRQNKRSAIRQAFNMRFCGGKSVNPFEKRFFY